MPITKLWNLGSGEFGYSDLSGGLDFSFALQPYNYYQDNSVPDSLSQYSYRFFNNDGNESSSTPKANLNVSPILRPSDIVRLRFLLNATGDFSSKRFKLECRYSPPGGSFGPWETIL